MTKNKDTHMQDIHNKPIHEHDTISFVITGLDAYNELTGVVKFEPDTKDFWVVTSSGIIKLDHDLLHVELIQNNLTPQKLPYGTKEEAQRRFNEKTIDIETRLCPLRDKHCRRSCICCRKLEIVNVGSLDNPLWECHGGHCTAYALVGPV